MHGLVPVQGLRRARSSGHAGNCFHIPGQQQEVTSEEVYSAVLQVLPHAVSQLSDTVRLASYAIFIKEDSGVQRGSMSSSKVHSHKGVTPGHKPMLVFQVQGSFYSTSFLKNQEPVCGTQEQQNRILSNSNWVWCKEH